MAELKASGIREFGVEAVYDHVPGAEVLDPNTPEEEVNEVSSIVITLKRQDVCLCVSNDILNGSMIKLLYNNSKYLSEMQKRDFLNCYL